MGKPSETEVSPRGSSLGVVAEKERERESALPKKPTEELLLEAPLKMAATVTIGALLSTSREDTSPPKRGHKRRSKLTALNAAHAKFVLYPKIGGPKPGTPSVDTCRRPILFMNKPYTISSLARSTPYTCAE